MRVVIDLQGAQSYCHRNRGIGRYTLSLAQSLVHARGEHEVLIALNGLFADTINPIRATFDGLLPQENVLVWKVPEPVNALAPKNDARRLVAELLREQFLASLFPDVLLVTSLFEGQDDNAVTSVHLFSCETLTAVILYDLIPLVHSKTYLKNPVTERWYKSKLDHLGCADLLLTISESSRQEAIEHLGFNHQQICNISTAAEDHFRVTVVTSEELNQLATQYGLVRPFMMYTGGIDYRKNIEGLIAAYALLPAELRKSHQLAVVCSISQTDRDRLHNLASEAGLAKNELILTGFIPEKDLLSCYRACKVFVFPSWHEGFGLPALEAMQCGKAVIASNRSSLPEVLGRDDMLFDPFDTSSIAKKMMQVLSNDTFRAELERHGLEQARKFSWDSSANKTWQALETVFSKNQVAHAPLHRPRLAYISPLPPENSGISDYSAELLPELAHFYHIEVIIAQQLISDAWVRVNCPIRNIKWFREHAHEFDRVLYHFGNSSFHDHMFALLHDHPGVVVMHDFFLSDVIAYQDISGGNPNSWARALMTSHGWPAVIARFQAPEINSVVEEYPCNLQVLQDALGVIVHSDYSCQLARNWYGENAANHWSQIPLLRKPSDIIDSTGARRALGLDEEAFVVCSFGYLAPTKLNHQLLAAWLASPLAQNPQCYIVFVGQNHGGDYGTDLVCAMRNASVDGNRIKITGWVDSTVYQQWLAAADVGVQLRTLSRGETSATVLDCMNYGLATIVNSNGSMAELDQSAVWAIPDKFDENQLIEALTTLWSDQRCRDDLGKKARHVIAKRHDPSRCAAMYAEAIEGSYSQAAVGIPGLLAAIATQESYLQSSEWPSVATCIAMNTVPKPRRKQLLVDVSGLVETNLITGIQCVVHAVLTDWLRNPPLGWQVEPVYGVEQKNRGYYYARQFTSKFLGVWDEWAVDEVVEVHAGDVFVALDLHWSTVEQTSVLKDWHRRGVRVQFIVYDYHHSATKYRRWMETVAQFDGAICTSRTVADEFQAWMQTHGPMRKRTFSVQCFQLGAGAQNRSLSTTDMPAESFHVLEILQLRPSFLTTAATESQKSYSQILSAFELLWAQNIDANLVLISKQDWAVESSFEQLRNHPELGKRLLWLEGINDEYLSKVYSSSTCLIAASENDCFGLPLIEAAQHKLPIIARDTPVFREVANGYAFYFKNLKSPQVIAKVIMQWLELHDDGKVPQSVKIPWLTWAQSAQQLMDIVRGKNK